METFSLLNVRQIAQGISSETTPPKDALTNVPLDTFQTTPHGIVF